LLLPVCLFGCSQQRCYFPVGLADRILPPPDAGVPEEVPAPNRAAPEANSANPKGFVQPKETQEVALEQPDSPRPPQGNQAAATPGQTLNLMDAIDLAFQLQPRLKASLESIAQARGREDIAFSAFLPVVSAGYSIGGFNLGVGGTGLPISGLPNSPAFNFLPPGGALPVGLNVESGYGLAELKLEWMICDFGKRSGLYDQASLAVDIAQLQTERAYQTVANEVAVAYYEVLRARSLHRIADEAVHRADDDLGVTKKLAKGGVVEREKVLRAEVALAQAERARDVVEEAEGIAVASLNLAVGLNVSASTGVVDTTDIPPFKESLGECLQTAVGDRREFRIARKSVRVAQEGSQVAQADFAPRIVADGYANDFEEFTPRGHADLALGFIKLEWGLFDGGKRVAELDVQDSRIREAVAEAESIADTIAFQVNQAYRQLVAARKGIDRSRPAVDQTRETYRLVAARAQQGDATPSELTDADAALTRAQQDYFNAIYDYLTALARLEYAMGVTSTPVTAGPCP
jgi:outer membrane protein TolC